MLYHGETTYELLVKAATMLRLQVRNDSPTREMIAKACQEWMDSPMIEPLELADAVLALLNPSEAKCWCGPSDGPGAYCPAHGGIPARAQTDGNHHKHGLSD